MEDEVEILAFHGWGLSAAAWTPWRERLPPTSTLRCFDRGYFGDPQAVQWGEQMEGAASRPRFRLLLLHSMAPLFLPRQLLPGADAVLFFGAFHAFHPSGGSEEKGSREILSRMRDALELDPWQVIASFEKRCGMVGRGGAIADSPQTLDTTLLANDLERLDSEEVDLRVLREVPRAMVFHGTADRIVPHGRGVELAASLGGSATFLPIEGAGHALPFSHADEVMNLIDTHLHHPWTR